MPPAVATCKAAGKTQGGFSQLLQAVLPACNGSTLQDWAQQQAKISASLFTFTACCKFIASWNVKCANAKRLILMHMSSKSQDAQRESGKTSLQPVQLKRAACKGGKGGALPALDSPGSAGLLTLKFVHKARNELAKLEMEIPWEAVHKSWRLQRAQWRKVLKQAESVNEVIGAVSELRNALAIPGSPFSHYGGSWDRLLSHCRCGCSLEELSRLLADLKANARAWIRVRDQQMPEIKENQKAMAIRGLQALWQAIKLGPTAVAQCPLEAILDYDTDALNALRELLQREINLQAASAAMGGEEASRCAVGSVFASMQEQRGLQQSWHMSPGLTESHSGDTASGSMIS